MSDDNQPPIVVKRVTKTAAAGHGSAWKIAYADFMTAMMAFFLLLWLLNSTSHHDLEGIAEQFMNPLALSWNGGSGSGDRSSVIPGGGEDLSRSVGQQRRGEIENLRERVRLEDLKRRLEALIDADPKLRSFRNQILMDITFEGLRIQIVDEQNRPMFNIASDLLQPYTRDLLHAIGRALNDVPNRLSLSGHTDAAQYAGGLRGFSNWELSANRANASRRELIAGGLDPAKVVRVVGLAETVPFNEDDLFDPTNRRISIIVMNRRTEESVRAEGGLVDVDSTLPVDDETLRRNIERQAKPAPLFLSQPPRPPSEAR